MRFTQYPVPKKTEVYQADDGLWYADILTDVSRINIYSGDSEDQALAEIRETCRR